MGLGEGCPKPSELLPVTAGREKGPAPQEAALSVQFYQSAPREAGYPELSHGSKELRSAGQANKGEKEAEGEKEKDMLKENWTRPTYTGVKGW